MPKVVVPIATPLPPAPPAPLPRATPQPSPVRVSATPTVQTAAGTALVEIVDNGYWPDYLPVRKGTTITWQHIGNAPHDAISFDNVWHTKTLLSGNRFEWTFNELGTYRYYCTFHPEMTGVIVVEP